jgi:copper chaperone NosL
MNAVRTSAAPMRTLLHLMAISLLTLVASMLATGCSTQSDEPEIVRDRTACSNCKMLISETHFAAAFRVGDVDQVFDDIGCMLEKLADDPSLKPQQLWARDQLTDSWITADNGYYAYSPELRTPMGFGYVAYANRSEAEAAAAKVSGKVFNGFGDIQSHHKGGSHVH